MISVQTFVYDPKEHRVYWRCNHFYINGCNVAYSQEMRRIARRITQLKKFKRKNSSDIKALQTRFFTLAIQRYNTISPQVRASRLRGLDAHLAIRGLA